VTVDETAFSGWNAVSFPYCDGSVFMGDNDVPVPENGDVHHFHGRQNLAAGLDVALAHFPHPKRVLLIGWSAGGYGTITAMIATRLRYPDTELYVLDDSGPGLVNLEETTDIEERLSEWNYGELFPESCAECAGGRGQFAPLFDWMLERDEDVRIGVASHYQDPVIAQFLRMPPQSYEPLLRETLTPIFETHPERFKRFMLPGTLHVLWPGQKAAGVPLDTWTVAMTNRDDATWVDIQADCAYRCCHPDQVSCEAEPGCTAVFGKAVLTYPDTFVGCIPEPSHCDDVVTCAEGLLLNASDSGCRMFPNSCIPSGWEEFPCDTHVCGPWDLEWGKN
jgi:pimeloyl-ACP methyl ester carboxylesterase